MIARFVQTLFPRVKQFFAGDAPPDRRYRSRAGLLLTLILIPLLLGVLACLPVPVGDPEKSRIDPALSGIWTGYADGDAVIIVLDPYDKRSWLLSLIELDSSQDPKPGEATEPGVNEPVPEISLLELLHSDQVDQIRVKDVSLYKSWLTRIKGVTFITWESKTLSETLPEMVPEYWFVYRVRRSGGDILYLDQFDYEVDDLDKVKTRKEAEKIIRRHVDDPAFFPADSNPFLELQKVPESEYETLARLLPGFRARKF